MKAAALIALAWAVPIGLVLDARWFSSLSLDEQIRLGPIIMKWVVVPVFGGIAVWCWVMASIGIWQGVARADHAAPRVREGGKKP